MGLSTDLATAQGLATSLSSHGASSLVITDANQTVSDLQSQINLLQSDKTAYQALRVQLASDGANSTVLADADNVIADLTVFLS